MYDLPFDLSRTPRVTYNVTTWGGIENVMIATMRWGYPPHHPLPFADIPPPPFSSLVATSPSPPSPPLPYLRYNADFAYRFLEYLLEVEYEYCHDDPMGVVSTARYHLELDRQDRANGRRARFNEFETEYIRKHAARLHAKYGLDVQRRVGNTFDIDVLKTENRGVPAFEECDVDFRFDHCDTSSSFFICCCFPPSSFPQSFTPPSSLTPSSFRSDVRHNAIEHTHQTLTSFAYDIDDDLEVYVEDLGGEEGGDDQWVATDEADMMDLDIIDPSNEEGEESDHEEEAEEA